MCYQSRHSDQGEAVCHGPHKDGAQAETLSVNLPPCCLYVYFCLPSSNIQVDHTYSTTTLLHSTPRLCSLFISLFLWNWGF